MALAERRTSWEWWFDAPPARVWPLVLATNPANRLAGLPPPTCERREGGDGVPTLLAKQTYYGLMTAAYEEEPFEWEEGKRHSVVRLFSKGPVTRFRVEARR